MTSSSDTSLIAKLTRAWKRFGRIGVDAREHAVQDVANVHRRKVERLNELLVGRPMRAWEMLDVGCGYHFPQVALFYGRVARIEGLDIQPDFFRDSFACQLVHACTNQGFTKRVYGTLYKGIFFSIYYRHLQSIAGRHVPMESLHLTSYDGGRFPFPDETFDAVISSAVLEHVVDMEGFASECARVLKRGGVLDMWWHNWYCPSGSHAEPSDANWGPWGHLLGGPSLPGLNHLSPTPVSEAFERHLRVIGVTPADALHRLVSDPEYTREGVGLLTPEWRERLSSYPEDLLTSTGFVIQARKGE